MKMQQQRENMMECIITQKMYKKNSVVSCAKANIGTFCVIMTMIGKITVVFLQLNFNWYQHYDDTSMQHDTHHDLVF